MSITLDFDEQALNSLPLGPGERERHMQIELACRYYANAWITLGQADVLLMDEKRGREAARSFGLVVAGALGELIHAKHAGWIPSVRDEIHRLRLEAGFFVDATVERFILSQVGE